MTLVTVALPAMHATDWWDRCGDEFTGSHVAHQTARRVTLTLTPAALADLRSDAEHYAECMGPADTGDFDYRPAARRCLAALDKHIEATAPDDCTCPSWVDTDDYDGPGDYADAMMTAHCTVHPHGGTR